MLAGQVTVVDVLGQVPPQPSSPTQPPAQLGVQQCAGTGFPPLSTFTHSAPIEQVLMMPEPQVPVPSLRQIPLALLQVKPCGQPQSPPQPSELVPHFPLLQFRWQQVVPFKHL